MQHLHDSFQQFLGLLTKPFDRCGICVRTLTQFADARMWVVKKRRWLQLGGADASLRSDGSCPSSVQKLHLCVSSNSVVELILGSVASGPLCFCHAWSWITLSVIADWGMLSDHLTPVRPPLAKSLQITQMSEGRVVVLAQANRSCVDWCWSVDCVCVCARVAGRRSSYWQRD